MSAPRESDILRAVQLEASRLGARVMRNNVGQARTDNGWRVVFGLCPGSSDLIGWTADGRFLAIEVKTPTGRVKREQQAFIDAVNAAGGVAGVARSAGDVAGILAPGGGEKEAIPPATTQLAGPCISHASATRLAKKVKDAGQRLPVTH